MSHLPERTEKNCLNCGAEVQGRFCQVCGQENTETKESFWQLLTHFVYDITHFDGKFFSTLKYLLFKPGYLSREYIRGKRATYLHPIRMYVFTSAIFFLLFFSLTNDVAVVKISETKNTAADVVKKLEKRKAKLQNELKDSLSKVSEIETRKIIALINEDLANIKKDSIYKDSLKTEPNSFNIIFINEDDRSYRNIHEYDSIQQILPEKERDNFFLRKLAIQNLHLKEKYQNNGKAAWEAIADKFKHLFPQIMFISLPLFALLLKLLYIRRKKYYYVNHVVFAIHLYCASFIIILLPIVVNAILMYFGTTIPEWLGILFMLLYLFYWYKAVRTFYEQGRSKSIFKYLLILFLSYATMAILFVFFFFFSAMVI